MCVKKIITTAFSRGAVILHKYRFSVWVKLYSALVQNNISQSTSSKKRNSVNGVDSRESCCNYPSIIYTATASFNIGCCCCCCCVVVLLLCE